MNSYNLVSLWVSIEHLLDFYFYYLLSYPQTLDEAKDGVMCVSTSDHEILTGSLDGYTRVYDLRNGQLVSNCIGGKKMKKIIANRKYCFSLIDIN